MRSNRSVRRLFVGVSVPVPYALWRCGLRAAPGVITESAPELAARMSGALLEIKLILRDPPREEGKIGINGGFPIFLRTSRL